jgi:hypothetical protein
MRAPAIEMANILGQDLLQMAPIEDECMVQALGPYRLYPALGDGVGPRRSEWRANLGNTKISDPPIEGPVIAAVAVMYEKSRLAIPSAAFNNLLCRPLGGWIRSDLYVQNLPAGVMDYEKHVQRSKRDRLDAKEVARPNS